MIKRAFLVALAAFTPSLTACIEITQPGMTRVCTAHDPESGMCIQYETRESPEARRMRESTDEPRRRAAYERNEPFFPTQAPGESSEHYLQRAAEEKQRQDAYRRNEAYFPPDEPGGSATEHAQRIMQERQREDAYHSGQPYSPPWSPPSTSPSSPFGGPP